MLTSNDPDEATVNVDVIFHVGTVDAVASDIDPNTLNLASNGKWMTSYVELPAGYDPADVVIETVMFNGVVLADAKFFAYEEDFNGNGIPDLMFKFSRSEIEGLLVEGEEVEVTVTGEIRDTIYFVATDIIRVINPTVVAPNGGEFVAPHPRGRAGRHNVPRTGVDNAVRRQHDVVAAGETLEHRRGDRPTGGLAEFPAVVDCHRVLR